MKWLFPFLSSANLFLSAEGIHGLREGRRGGEAEGGRRDMEGRQLFISQDYTNRLWMIVNTPRKLLGTQTEDF